MNKCGGRVRCTGNAFEVSLAIHMPIITIDPTGGNDNA